MGNPMTALEASLVQAEAAIEGGRPGEALDLITEAEHAARGEGDSLLARVGLQQGRALLDLGRLDEARSAVSAGLKAAEEQDLPLERALLLQLRSRLARVLAGEGGTGPDDADLVEAGRILASLGAVQVVPARVPE
jgi:hypothetical protein